MTVSRNTPPNLPTEILPSQFYKMEYMFRKLLSSNEPGYPEVRRYISQPGEIQLDAYALYQGSNWSGRNVLFPSGWSQAKKDWTAVQKIFRLGYKVTRGLGMPLRSIDTQFLKVFYKIYNPTHQRFETQINELPAPGRIYRIAYHTGMIRIDKMRKIFRLLSKYLRRAIRRTPYEQELHWATSTFFGDAYWEFMPPITNSNSNINSNSNSNSNSNNKRIKWRKVTLNNAPRNEITFSNFSNGNKAVKLSWKLNGKTHFQFLEPQTFRDMAKMNMTNAFNKAPNFTLFKNPFTRGMTKRSNIDFVILNINKRKTAAATKIQKVVRGSQVRTKIRRNAEQLRRNAERATKLASIVQRRTTKKKSPSSASRRKLAANAANKRARKQ